MVPVARRELRLVRSSGTWLDSTPSPPWALGTEDKSGVVAEGAGDDSAATRFLPEDLMTGAQKFIGAPVT